MIQSTPKFEIVALNNIEVMADVSLLQKTDDLFFNATEMAKQFGKKPIEWLDSKQAAEYIGVILEVENFHFEDLVRTVQGGKYQGTWLHKKLALPFARWLSVKFEYALDKWVTARLNEEHQRKQRRLDLKTGFLPLTKAIQSTHDEPKFYHFTTECDLIKAVLLSGEPVDSVTAFKQHYITRLAAIIHRLRGRIEALAHASVHHRRIA